MSIDQARAQLFDDTLQCELVLPCRIQPRLDGGDAGAEMRLRAVALVEDGRIEDIEERQDKGPAFQRLEAKVDLLMAMCGRLLSNQQVALAPAPARISPRGICLALPPGAGLPDGDRPWAISFQAADWLPDPVTLPVSLLARWEEEGRTRLALAFDGLPAGLQEALERHVFRLHRRAIAQHRQLR